ncbi:hypothetical protein O6H91_11G024900 [Diphasiastrum complanatum]|uniref:Uncharacterized protein n=1 Tax=Diphasiastrum complanatum TaxID=34168 RepID=A0ACC2C762_DIPCM|nr:hypothetical protein O6H91_11G024900 [Diphasiastrum complanatum]
MLAVHLAWVIFTLLYAFFPRLHRHSCHPSCSLSKENCRELAALNLNLNISFSNTAKASQDFGHMYHDRPSAVLYASSAQDIVAIVKLAYFSPNHLTIAAKGAGHSIYGQAQALHGIVIEMSSLKGIEVGVHGFGEAAVPFDRRGEGGIEEGNGAEISNGLSVSAWEGDCPMPGSAGRPLDMALRSPTSLNWRSSQICISSSSEY